MTKETERIVRILEKTFDKQPWYGSSIMEVLSQVTPEKAHQRIGTSHTITELVLHMTTWRQFAIHRLQGDNNFEVSEAMNFPHAGSIQEAVKALHQSQMKLLEAAASFPDERLGDLVPSKTQRYTYYTLLHGIAQHDIYHLGQIALLLKAV
ncbi:MAG: DinB family protein [Bacteroidetes bacterium]|nr:DinB family protein [Bacteroidota bacterium]MBS1976090.1 DinB family protein [Bacteroidota bacterium]